MSDRGLSVLLAGDALMVRPWSHVDDAAFLALVELVRSADVSILNLETVIHEFRGYAQADSGGSYTHAPPCIAAELAWAGFTALSHANNHTFDYGSTAVLETLDHAARAGLLVAGSGEDLQRARSPRFVQRIGTTVALVAMASTFVRYGRASRSRADMRGRPGLNPLALHRRKPTVVLPPPAARSLRAITRRVGSRFKDLGGGAFEYVVRFKEGRFDVFRDWSVVDDDRTANLDVIAEAAKHADVVVVSIHAHDQGRWLRTFAHEAIDHGASVVFVHGPHHLRGIEMRAGRPVFYCLGDFVYEAEHIGRFPSEAYEKAKLDASANVADILAAPGSLKKIQDDRRTFEGAMAMLDVSGGSVSRIRLYPIDLQFDAAAGARGRPRLADPALGRRIIATVAERSGRYGTKVVYDPTTNIAEVTCR